MIRHSFTCLGLAAVLLSLAAPASAHFNLTSPPQTSTDTGGGKGDPPCGPDTMMATTPTPAQGGHMLPLMIDETTRHGGFYRVALALTSRDALPVDNTVYDSNNMVLIPGGAGTSDHADYADQPVFPVLADNLFPHEQAGNPMMFTGEVMLPNITCARCILQVIEFMAPHGSNGAAGFFYHHCAELNITADPALPIFDPNNPGGAGGAGGTGGTGGATGGGGAGGIAAGGVGGTTGGTGGQPVGGTGGTVTVQGGSAGQAVAFGGTAGTSTGGSVAAAGAVTSAGGTPPVVPASSAGDSGGCALVPTSGGNLWTLIALTLSALTLSFRRRR